LLTCKAKFFSERHLYIWAAQPRCAADTAGAAGGLGAIYPAKRFGLLVTRQSATFSRAWRLAAPRTPQVGCTRIAWQLPLLGVLHSFRRLPTAQLTAKR